MQNSILWTRIYFARERIISAGEQNSNAWKGNVILEQLTITLRERYIILGERRGNAWERNSAFVNEILFEESKT